MVAYRPDVTQCQIAQTFGITRITARKWLEEIREEQIRTIDKESLKRELWRLEEKAKEYLLLLTYLRSDINHLYDKFPHVILGIIKTGWMIEKELFELKFDLYSRQLEADDSRKIDLINQKMGMATIVNVQH